MNAGMPAHLQGRTVLITGASSGLGARFALAAARSGANVVVCARRVDRLDALVARIAAEGGLGHAVALDVTSEASTERAFDEGEARFGPIDSVVANAGISGEGRAIDMPVEAFDRVFATNVRGVFLTARTAARRMQASGVAGRGRVVLVSSITARMRTNGLAAYSASKAAVTHLGALLGKEWARTGPNVTTLSPGYIATELAGEWFRSEAGQRQIARWPRKRLLEEDALDDMMIYLLSDASAGVTGSDFVVDDGQSL